MPFIRQAAARALELASAFARTSAALLFTACLSGNTPGYSASSPTEITCGCHDGQSCYDAAAEIDKTRGENASTGEELLYYSQCACFQGSMAGCNTLGHFAKDWVKACERGDDIANSCAIAGFVHHHGVRVPRLNGRSYDRDAAAAKAEFDRACAAGSKVACEAAPRVR